MMVPYSSEVILVFHQTTPDSLYRREIIFVASERLFARFSVDWPILSPQNCARNAARGS